jgi:putative DNA primase/helicase
MVEASEPQVQTPSANSPSDLAPPAGTIGAWRVYTFEDPDDPTIPQEWKGRPWWALVRDESRSGGSPLALYQAGAPAWPADPDNVYTMSAWARAKAAFVPGNFSGIALVIPGPAPSEPVAPESSPPEQAHEKSLEGPHTLEARSPMSVARDCASSVPASPASMNNMIIPHPTDPEQARPEQSPGPEPVPASGPDNGQPPGPCTEPAAQPGQAWNARTIIRPDPESEAWRDASFKLVLFTLDHLVNRTDIYGGYKRDGSPITAKDGLDHAKLDLHFRPRTSADIIGLHAIAAEEIVGPDGQPIVQNTSKSCNNDIDHHSPGAPPDRNFAAALAWHVRAETLGFRPLLVDSNGNGGFRNFIIFREPVRTELAYHLIRWLQRDWAEFGFAAEPEAFPKQERLGLLIKGRGKWENCGSWVRLFGRHHKRAHHTRFWDGTAWLAGADAIAYLLDHTGDDPALIPPEVHELAGGGPRMQSTPAPLPTPGPSANGDPADHPSEDKVRAALAYYPNRDLDYDDWLDACFALHDWDPARGWPIFLEWSRQSAKHDDAKARKSWDSCTPGGGVTIRTIFKKAVDNGWKPNPGPTLVWPVSAPGNGTATVASLDAGLAGFMRTDIGNGERLVARHGHDFRYCFPWSKPLVFDGRRWKVDDTAAVQRLAKATSRAIYREASTRDDDDERKALIKWGLASESRSRLDAMLARAFTEDGIPILPDEMDQDGWLFNCRNGTIDLRTGELREHRRADLITQLCPVDFDPHASCPLWIGTLEKFFGGDSVLVDYWKRICGYAMAGLVRDHVMPIAYGTGSNGKSTILGALLEAFGVDYAMKCPPDLLMVKKGDSHPTDRADLFRKRLVVAIETEAGRRLNETMVKELTGGDHIRARRMREDFWEFSPTHTLIMATNHKPRIRGTDQGIWRRLRVVPFTVSVEGDRDDKAMPEKLRGELAGILAWCVQGCLAWQEKGLDAPASVEEATTGYRKSQDMIGSFLAEHVVEGPQEQERCGQVYERYKAWAQRGNEFAISMTAFGQAMQERGFRTKTSNGKWYLGLALRKLTDAEIWEIPTP